MDKKNISKTDQTKRREPLKDTLMESADPKALSTDNPKQLGFYDEEKDKWVCEDECLEKKDTEFCGTTDHL